MIKHFIIPGEPQGKGRPRFTKQGRAYTPSKTAAYESVVRACYLSQAGGEVFQAGEPLCMTIDFVYAIPKSAGKKKREMMLNTRIFPTKKPDLDNALKAIADALNGIAYRDDAQITSVCIRKRYGAEPRAIVYISKEDV